MVLYPPKPCQGCGRLFQARGNQRYCDHCAVKTCESCGVSFVPDAKSLQRAHQYCSSECYLRARHGTTCRMCGKPTDGRSLCSDECRRARERQKDAARAKDKRQRERLKGWEQKIAFMRSLGGACVQCGNDDLRVLEFHHKDPSIKDSRVRDHTGGPFSKRLKILESERDNLELLCANCHRIKTHAEIWHTVGIV